MYTWLQSSCRQSISSSSSSRVHNTDGSIDNTTDKYRHGSRIAAWSKDATRTRVLRVTTSWQVGTASPDDDKTRSRCLGAGGSAMKDVSRRVRRVVATRDVSTTYDVRATPMYRVLWRTPSEPRVTVNLLSANIFIYSVSQKNPPFRFLAIFSKRFGIFNHFLHTYTFLSTLKSIYCCL